LKVIIDLLRDPVLDGIDVDGIDRLNIHRTILEKKRMLRVLFVEFHHLFRNLENRYLTGNGIKVELGAGVSPMRDTYPEVLATDIVAASHLDKIINAECMEFADSSVKVVYGQNCFHHFPHPELFFQELDRVLVPGGGAILLEPYYGFFASMVYKRLFQTEGFDKLEKSWETPMEGPMNGANQALSYIIFVRDRKLFESKFPDLEIVYEKTTGNYFKYLLSGGLNFRQLLPDVFTGLITVVEKLVSPFNKWIALHHVVVIKKALKNSTD